MFLFRPVGLEELRLVYEAKMRAFPPRLPDQPIFYPVTNDGYARQIARDWNTKAGTRAGFVTQFSLADEYAARFERRVVGAKEHEELWVPAEELAELNTNIDGRIAVVDAFFGDGYQGVGAAGKNARDSFVDLARAADVGRAIASDHVALFLDFFLWEQTDFADDGIETAARDVLLAELRNAWRHGEHGSLALGLTPAPVRASFGA